MYSDSQYASARDNILNRAEALWDRLLEGSREHTTLKAIIGVMSAVCETPAVNGLVPRSETVDRIVHKRSYPAVYGLAMYSLLARSLLTLNSHVDISLMEAANMRLFEATGVGACVLTEDQKNLGEIFEPGKEVVTYSCKHDAVEKARYLLDHENVCKEIAKAGQKRVLRDHTFGHRVRLLDSIIQESLRNA